MGVQNAFRLHLAKLMVPAGRTQRAHGGAAVHARTLQPPPAPHRGRSWQLVTTTSTDTHCEASFLELLGIL